MKPKEKRVRIILQVGMLVDIIIKKLAQSIAFMFLTSRAHFTARVRTKFLENSITK